MSYLFIRACEITCQTKCNWHFNTTRTSAKSTTWLYRISVEYNWLISGTASLSMILFCYIISSEIDKKYHPDRKWHATVLIILRSFFTRIQVTQNVWIACRVANQNISEYDDFSHLLIFPQLFVQAYWSFRPSSISQQ